MLSAADSTPSRWTRAAPSYVRSFRVACVGTTFECFQVTACGLPFRLTT